MPMRAISLDVSARGELLLAGRAGERRLNHYAREAGVALVRIDARGHHNTHFGPKGKAVIAIPSSRTRRPSQVLASLLPGGRVRVWETTKHSHLPVWFDLPRTGRAFPAPEQLRVHPVGFEEKHIQHLPLVGGMVRVGATGAAMVAVRDTELMVTMETPRETVRDAPYSGRVEHHSDPGAGRRAGMFTTCGWDEKASTPRDAIMMAPRNKQAGSDGPKGRTTMHEGTTSRSISATRTVKCAFWTRPARSSRSVRGARS